MPSRRFPSGCIISHLSTAVKSDGSPVLPYDIYSCCNEKKEKRNYKQEPAADESERSAAFKESHITSSGSLRQIGLHY